MNATDFTVGDQVRWGKIVDPGDDECVFDIIEDNGDRVLIRLVCDLPILPIQLARRADLVRQSALCPACKGVYDPSEYKPGVCRHCISDVPCPPDKTLCAECAEDDQICPTCGYPLGS